MDADSSTRDDFVRNLKKDAENFEVKIGGGDDVKISGGDDELVLERIVRFDKDESLSSYCHDLGLVRMPGQAEVIFLLRREYYAVWDTIKSMLKADSPETQFIVTGTAGIGKSAFRFFVLREWLLGSDEVGYQSVVFNEGKSLCRVDKAGQVSTYQVDFELDFNSIFVLDPCELVDKVKRVPYRTTIVTSSPSPIINRYNDDFSLRSFCGHILVMSAWTTSEIMSVSPKFEVERFMKFSYLKGGERLCIPRWLYSTDSQAELEIESYCNQDSQAALQTFLKTSADHVRDMNMPYALCVIEDIPGRGWGATGFISDYVEKLIHKWVNAQSVLDNSGIF